MIRLIDCYTELMVYVEMIVTGKADKTFDQTHTLIETLVARSRVKAHEAGFNEESWLNGFFPVAAWIDETILCSEWTHRDGWVKFQLQRKYFDINNAGDVFFKKIESPESISSEILAVYDLILATGFCGCYYHNPQDAGFSEIRKTIVRQLTGNSDPVFPEELFEDAYQPLSESGKNTRNRWYTVPVNSFTVSMAALPVVALIILHLILGADLDHLVAKYLQPDMPTFLQQY